MPYVDRTKCSMREDLVGITQRTQARARSALPFSHGEEFFYPALRASMIHCATALRSATCSEMPWASASVTSS